MTEHLPRRPLGLNLALSAAAVLLCINLATSSVQLGGSPGQTLGALLFYAVMGGQVAILSAAAYGNNVGRWSFVLLDLVLSVPAGTGETSLSAMELSLGLSVLTWILLFLPSTSAWYEQSAQSLRDADGEYQRARLKILCLPGIAWAFTPFVFVSYGVPHGLSVLAALLAGLPFALGGVAVSITRFVQLRRITPAAAQVSLIDAQADD